MFVDAHMQLYSNTWCVVLCDIEIYFSLPSCEEG